MCFWWSSYGLQSFIFATFGQAFDSQHNEEASKRQRLEMLEMIGSSYLKQSQFKPQTMESWLPVRRLKLKTNKLTFDLEKDHNYMSPMLSHSTALDNSSMLVPIPAPAMTILSSEDGSQSPSPMSNSLTKGAATAIITTCPTTKATSISTQPTSNPVRISGLSTQELTQLPTSKQTSKPRDK